jgi:hypothetical protein
VLSHLSRFDISYWAKLTFSFDFIRGSTESSKQAVTMIQALINNPDKELSELLTKLMPAVVKPAAAAPAKTAAAGQAGAKGAARSAAASAAAQPGVPKTAAASLATAGKL